MTMQLGLGLPWENGVPDAEANDAGVFEADQPGVFIVNFVAPRSVCIHARIMLAHRGGRWFKATTYCAQAQTQSYLPAMRHESYGSRDEAASAALLELRCALERARDNGTEVSSKAARKLLALLPDNLVGAAA